MRCSTVVFADNCRNAYQCDGCSSELWDTPYQGTYTSAMAFVSDLDMTRCDELMHTDLDPAKFGLKHILQVGNQGP